MAKVKSRGAIGRNNRAKGHLLETKIAKDMRDIGYTFAKTSRQASRLLDDCQIDIAGVPYNIQAKSGYEKSRPKFDVISRSITENLIKNYPPEDAQHGHPTILIHKLPGGQIIASIDYSFLLTLLKLQYEQRK